MPNGSGMVILSQNEFLANLTNLIVVTRVNNTVSNEVSALVRSCSSEDISFGNGKALISVDTLGVNDYSPDSSLLKNTPPTVDEQQLTTTDKKVIAVTINKYLLTGAFANEYSMSECITVILGMLEKTKNIYLYKKCVKAYQDWTGGKKNDGTALPALTTQTVQVNLKDTTALSGADLQQTMVWNSNQIAKKCIEVSQNMASPSREYNELGYETMLTKNEIKLVMNSKYENMILVDTRATLFNSDKIESEAGWTETIVVPKQQFDDTSTAENVIGWLGHKEKFQISPRFTVGTSFFDGSNLMQNEWLHFWLIAGFANGLPLVKLVANYV